MIVDSVSLAGNLSVNENHCDLKAASKKAQWTGSGNITLTNSRVSGKVKISLAVPFAGKQALGASIQSPFHVSGTYTAQQQHLVFSAKSDSVGIKGCIAIPLPFVETECTREFELSEGGSISMLPSNLLPDSIL